MSYQLLINKDRPVLFKTFEDATNKSHPLVAGVGRAALITTTPFQHDFESWGDYPFTAEVWFKPVNEDRVRILGHDSDGIWYENGFVEAVVAGGDKATVKAPTTSMYIVYQYTGDSVVLSVNGVQASVDVNNLPKDTGALRSGPGPIVVDALAIYDYVVNDSVLSNHYYEGVSFPDRRVLYNEAENYFTGSEDTAEILVSKDYPDWSEGHLESVVVVDDRLVKDDNVPVGYWYTSIIISNESTIYGSKIRYSYEGVEPTVEVSVDSGFTWSEVDNLSSIPGLPVDGSAFEEDPVVRISIPEGCVLLSFSFAVYSSNHLTGDRDTRHLVVESGVPTVEMTPAMQESVAGVVLSNGSASLVPVDDGDANNVVSVSFWYRGAEIAGGTKNGSIGHLNGQWNFYVKNMTASDSVIDLVSGYTGQIAEIATWPEPQDAGKLYDRYFSNQTVFVPEDTNLSLSDSEYDIEIYQNNWIVL